MSMNEKFANWLVGGELFRLRRRVNSINVLRAIESDQLASTMKNRDAWMRLAVDRGATLRKIEGMETPKSASIGRRMAKVARDGVKA